MLSNIVAHTLMHNMVRLGSVSLLQLPRLISLKDKRPIIGYLCIDEDNPISRNDDPEPSIWHTHLQIRLALLHAYLAPTGS